MRTHSVSVNIFCLKEKLLLQWISLFRSILKYTLFGSPFLLLRVPIWSPFHSKLGPHQVPIKFFLGPPSMWEQCKTTLDIFLSEVRTGWLYDWSIWQSQAGVGLSLRDVATPLKQSLTRWITCWRCGRRQQGNKGRITWRTKRRKRVGAGCPARYDVLSVKIHAWPFYVVF